MRPNSKGISLIELFIVVMLISTVATAYLNFRNDPGLSVNQESGLSGLDSAIYVALEEIGLDLRLAHRDSDDITNPLIIEHLGGTDRIIVSRDNVKYEYLVDRNGRLIRQTSNTHKILAFEILALKAQKLGKETIVLTITAHSAGEKDDGLRSVIHSYSKVVTVGLAMQ